MAPLTVIELFQSQGCNSCPPTNHNLLKLLDDPSILVLTYEVTYWDHLGWFDTFGNSAFDDRQWAYARALQRKNVFTPQIIANGQVSGIGGTSKDLHSLVEMARALDYSPLVEIQYDVHTKAVAVSGPIHQHGVVNLVQYDPAWIDVPISRGENGGKTLPHCNVVRQVISLGQWSGGQQEFKLPVLEGPGLKMAILLQTSEAGSILAAARL